MSKIIIGCRLIFTLILVGICSHSRCQNYFKEYIDSEENCDEFNNQVFIKNDSIYLINFISCDSSPYYTNILQYDSKGKFIKKLIIDDLITNVYSGHLKGEDLFIAGVNSGIKPDSKFSFWNGDLSLDSSNISQMNLFDTSPNVFLNTMGSVGMGSDKIIFGQYLLDNNPKIFSFLLWLNYDLSRDSLMVFDSTYDWSIISDADVDSQNNLVVLIETAKVINHLEYRNRIIQKYNPDKKKVFEWVSPQYGDLPEPGSFALIDSCKIVMEFVAEENGYIHSLIAINQEGKLEWEHIFHIDDPKSLYRINDIITCKDGGILCCGTYRNVSENIIETGYICKLDRNGNLLWERIFYDQEELNLPTSGIDKVIHFNSIAEGFNHSIVVGGRVIHNFLSASSKSDIFFAIVDSIGCLSPNCGDRQDITSTGEFLDSTTVWIETYSDAFSSNKWSLKFTIDSDSTLINGKEYYEVLESHSEMSTDWVGTNRFIRYENNIVYAPWLGTEIEMCNFNLSINDTFFVNPFQGNIKLIVDQIDTIVLLNGELRRRWKLRCHDDNPPIHFGYAEWVEGIGNINGLFATDNMCLFDGVGSDISCLYKNDQLVYDDPKFDVCWLMTTSTNEISDDKISIIPNPATDYITIESLKSEIINVKIFNVLGDLMYKGNDSIIHIDRFPSGYYLLNYILKNNQILSKGFLKL
ncbi:MAG: T9SS type A sorting domain-containing protein [Saprospiraceae bacterium]